MNQEIIDEMKNLLAMTLGNCISKLGFMSDAHGAFVKRVLAKNDEVLIMALGCYLDECIQFQSYMPLDRAVEDIEGVEK